MKLTIKIEDISNGKGKAFAGRIKEINTTICADTIPEIFSLVEDAIDTAKKNNIGIYNRRPGTAKNSKNLHKKAIA